MKKIFSVIASAALVLALTACGGSGQEQTSAEAPPATETAAQDSSAGTAEQAPEAPAGSGVVAADLKVGFIFIGDENEGYTAAHYAGAKEMQQELGLSDSQIIVKWNTPEDESSYDAAVDLAEQGCKLIIATSFGHEDYIMQAAGEFPEVEFCHATGFQAATSGLNNLHNFFTAIYESRYVSGVVAGMKLNEMLEAGTITEPKVGYVGAYPYAEVISGYTSFFLGVRSVCPEATMEVTYTNSWSSFDLEKEAAESLIAGGCVLISQHADTTGAPTACEAAGVPVVGYNISMIATAPTQALTSASINWGPYYTYAAQSVIDGTAIATDWSQGYSEGANRITELNTANVAAGTAEKVAEVEAAIKSGDLHVFDTSTWTVNGQKPEDNAELMEANKQYIYDGYFHESELSSAPAFAILIDGITDKTNQ